MIGLFNLQFLRFQNDLKNRSTSYSKWFKEKPECFVHSLVADLNAYPGDLLPAHGLLYFSIVVSHFTNS